MDRFQQVEKLARALANTLEEDFDEISESRRSLYRKAGYEVGESIIISRDNAYLHSADNLLDLMTEPSTPKRWAPGLREGATFLQTRVAENQLEREMRTPDVFDPELSTPDPYAFVEAGDEDPYADLPDTYPMCNSEGEGGWSCTRPKHPQHWQCFDTEFDGEHGEVFATWYVDNGGQLTGVHPIVFEIIDRYEDEG